MVLKLVVNIKLQPTSEQAQLLHQTLERANQACNAISKTGWEAEVFRQYNLHKLVYRDIRNDFGISAQMTIRCIAKVADAYKLDRKTQRRFRKYAAQPYDDRILRFCSDDIVSIWTLEGRIKVSTQLGDYQRRLLPFRKGEVDLMFVRKQWYLACVCDVDEPDAPDPEGRILGVDLGVVNLAVDSTGTEFSGEAVQKQRRIHGHRRKNLQRKGTRSAKRKLKKISGRQARFQKDINHRISKALVSKARTLRAAIALEDLKGIRKRGKASRRRQRDMLSNWGFWQLRQFVSYKARLAGVPVILIDPRYTSQTCPKCGQVDKRNRLTRDLFQCVRCGCAGPADTIAAVNIAARAAVNQPMVAGA